jgi:uncharacterized protein YfdQ (DUF2303 family)
MEDTQTEAAVVAALAARQVQSVESDIAPLVPLAALPAEMRIESLEKYMLTPLRTRAKATFPEPDSFTRYVNDYKQDSTRIFADEAAARFSCIIDYHGAKPQFCEHTAALQLKPTKAWLDWMQIHNRQSTQDSLAEFLEDHLTEIAQPDGGTVMDAVRFLTAKKSVDFKRATNLTNGTIALEYEEQIEARGKGNAEIPAEFTLLIQPYEYGDKFPLKARLRYRLKDDRLTFIVSLEKPEEILKVAFTQASRAVGEAAGITPLLGSVAV